MIGPWLTTRKRLTGAGHSAERISDCSPDLARRADWLFVRSYQVKIVGSVVSLTVARCWGTRNDISIDATFAVSSSMSRASAYRMLNSGTENALSTVSLTHAP